MIANSAHLILGVIAFVLFGYVSVLRIITQQYFPHSSYSIALKSLFSDTRLLANVGSSALFVSLPATSLLLFWGWAPALLWLLIAHLLIDSLAHLQVAAAEQIDIQSTALIRAETGFPRWRFDWLRSGLRQCPAYQGQPHSYEERDAGCRKYRSGDRRWQRK